MSGGTKRYSNSSIALGSFGMLVSFICSLDMIDNIRFVKDVIIKAVCQKYIFSKELIKKFEKLILI